MRVSQAWKSQGNRRDAGNQPYAGGSLRSERACDDGRFVSAPRVARTQMPSRAAAAAQYRQVNPTLKLRPSPGRKVGWLGPAWLRMA